MCGIRWQASFSLLDPALHAGLTLLFPFPFSLRFPFPSLLPQVQPVHERRGRRDVPVARDHDLYLCHLHDRFLRALFVRFPTDGRRFGPFHHLDIPPPFPPTCHGFRGSGSLPVGSVCYVQSGGDRSGKTVHNALLCCQAKLHGNIVVQSFCTCINKSKRTSVGKHQKGCFWGKGNFEAGHTRVKISVARQLLRREAWT